MFIDLQSPRTSLIYHRAQWTWSYVHQLSDLAHWGTTLWVPKVSLDGKTYAFPGKMIHQWHVFHLYATLPKGLKWVFTVLKESLNT